MVARDFQRFLVTTDELQSTKQLLEHGDQLLQDLRFLVRDVHVLTPVLAAGMEKLLKLTLGLLFTAAEGRWPGQRIQSYRHRLVELDAECRRLIRDRITQATHPQVVSAALDALTADPWAGRILELLQSYATKGRFFNLDYLGGQEQPADSPRTLWQRLDQQLSEQLPPPQLPASDDELDAYEQGRSALLVRSVRRWRWFYYTAWVQNVCGPDARQFAHEVRGPSLNRVD